MADDEDLNLDDGGGEAAPAKKKGIGNLFSGLLKWIIIAVAAIIVIIVVVFFIIYGFYLIKHSKKKRR